MKISVILALLQLSFIVKGALWVAVAQPALLAFGAILTAFNSEVLEDIKPIKWRIKLPDPEDDDWEDPNPPTLEKIEGKGKPPDDAEE